MKLTEDPATSALLVRQLGVISRRQLLTLAWTAPVIDGAVRHRRLEVVHRGVYRTPGSGQPPHQDAMAAVLRAGRGARATGAPVLQQLRNPGVALGAPALTLLPAPRRLLSNPVPWRRDLAPDADRRSLGPDHHGAQAVLALIAAGHPDQESHGERDLAASLVRLGLGPLVRWQIQLAADIRVDCLLDIVRAVLEYDGRAHHSDPRDRAADRRRDQRISDLGHRVVRITKDDLRDDDALRTKLERELGIDIAQLARLTM